MYQSLLIGTLIVILLAPVIVNCYIDSHVDVVCTLREMEANAIYYHSNVYWCRCHSIANNDALHVQVSNRFCLILS